MAKYLVTKEAHSVKHDGKVYKSGSELELTSAEAKECDPDGHHLVLASVAEKRAAADKSLAEADELAAGKGVGGDKGKGVGGDKGKA